MVPELLKVTEQEFIDDAKACFAALSKDQVLAVIGEDGRTLMLTWWGEYVRPTPAPEDLEDA